MPPETKWSNGNGTHEEHRPRRPAAARSAAHAAPDPAPVPATSPRPGSPAAAVHAALTASPAARPPPRIATAAGISRPAARDALTALETAGTVTRTKGGKPGIPDTWTLTATEPAGNEPGAGPGHDDEHADSSQPGDDPAGEDQDGPGQQEAASGAGQQEASAGTATPAPAQQARQPSLTTARPAAPGRGQPGRTRTAAASHEPGPRPPRPPTAAPPPATRRTRPSSRRSPGTSSRSRPPPPPPPPCWPAAGTCAPRWPAWTRSTSRPPRPAGRSRPPPAGRRPRPPGPAGCARRSSPTCATTRASSFTPHEIHKVLGHSSGAIANALDTLVKHGDAELATEKPRRFRLAGSAAAPAGPSLPPSPAPRTRARVRDGPGGCRMTTRADGRGGSTPPRPAAPDSTPGQWFVFSPWVYDVDAATRLLRAAPRPALLLPVLPWARAYGLIRDPGGGPQTISLIGPGPGFDPGYAMTTDPGRPGDHRHRHHRRRRAGRAAADRRLCTAGHCPPLRRLSCRSERSLAVSMMWASLGKMLVIRVWWACGSGPATPSDRASLAGSRQC